MTKATTTRTSTGEADRFGPLNQIDAGLLNVGYAEAGPDSEAQLNRVAPCGPGTNALVCR